jgi:hypothetical protein
MNENLSEFYYFASPIYKTNVPDYIKVMQTVANEYMEESKKDNIKRELYMSNNFANDDRIKLFRNVVLNASWDILKSQGYNMEIFNTFCAEMWMQEYNKTSYMEHHIHGLNSQIIAFYFLETPANCSRIVFHDPRPSKVINNLYETDLSQVTLASNAINFIPEPGDLFFTNAYLPHGFTQHKSNKPLKFIHMNINVSVHQKIQFMDEGNAVVI